MRARAALPAAGCLTSAEYPIGQAAQQQGNRKTEQRDAERSHRLRSEIEEVPERQRIVLGMFLQQIGEVGARRRSFGKQKQSEADGEDENANCE